MVAPGGLYSTRHMKKALTNTAATTRLTIDPAIFSVLTDARLRRRSKKMRSNRSRTMSSSNLWVRTNLAFPMDSRNRAT
jgi:hypothetical protein